MHIPGQEVMGDHLESRSFSYFSTHILRRPISQIDIIFYQVALLTFIPFLKKKIKFFGFQSTLFSDFLTRVKKYL